MDRPQPVSTNARYHIAQLTRKLRPESPIRTWLNRRREGIETTSVSELLSFLQHRNSDWADRAVGYHLLASLPLGPSEQEQASLILMKALKEPNDERPTITGSSAKWVVWTWLGWYLAAAAISLQFGDLLLGLFCSFFVAGFFCLLSAPIFLAIQDQLRANAIQRVAATSLAKVGTPTCLSVLYHYLRRPSIYRQEVLQALRSVLPRVNASWYGHLSTDAAVALTGIAGSTDEALALSALDALEQAGGGSSVKAVERIATRSPLPRVRSRAAGVLPILMARRENELSSSSLLRPSAEVQTEHLLHPVYSVAPDVTNLLRAAQPHDTVTPSQSERLEAKRSELQ